MNLTEIMKILAARKCHLSLDGDRIRIRGPKGAITESLKKAVAAYRVYIVERLTQESNKKGGE